MPARIRKAKMEMLMLKIKIQEDLWGQSSALLYTRKPGMICKVPFDDDYICFTYKPHFHFLFPSLFSFLKPKYSFR